MEIMFRIWDAYKLQDPEDSNDHDKPEKKGS